MSTSNTDIICFAPKYNVKRADATGAFQPEALRFLRHHGCDKSRLVLFDNKRSKRTIRKEILDALAGHVDEVEAVMFFCHGYKRGIQAGFGNKQVDELARAIVKATRDCYEDDIYPVVCLYACDAGRDIDRERRDDLAQFGGDGGFADLLRDALCRAGATFCRVDAHVSAGHTTKNPHVRRFFGDGSPNGGIGGYYLVPFRSRLWKKWRKALKGKFRYDFPFMTAAEIAAYLEHKR